MSNVISDIYLCRVPITPVHQLDFLTESEQDTYFSGTVVKTINNCSYQPRTASIKVKVAVDEMDIDKIVIGQKTQIKFDAVSDQTYEGAVESIAQTGTSSNNVTTYDVVVTVDNPNNIKVGMNANVTILIDSKDDALTVPTEALVSKDGNEYVMVANSGSTNDSSNTSTSSESGQSSRTGGGQLVQVKTGLQNENFVEVTEGVTEGENVLIALPKTSTTTSTANKSSFGGSSFSGASGASGGNSGQRSGASSTTSK